MCDTLCKVKSHVIYCRETHPIAQNNMKSGRRRRLCYACWQTRRQSEQSFSKLYGNKKAREHEKSCL